MLYRLFYNLHMVFHTSLSVNSDLNVNECLIADAKKNKQVLYSGKGGAHMHS